MANFFSGKVLFELKATHGIPLDISLDRLLNHGILIDWVEFIEQARMNGWYDYQTFEVIEDALRDIQYPKTNEILDRLKIYILKTIED